VLEDRFAPECAPVFGNVRSADSLLGLPVVSELAERAQPLEERHETSGSSLQALGLNVDALGRAFGTRSGQSCLGNVSSNFKGAHIGSSCSNVLNSFNGANGRVHFKGVAVPYIPQRFFSAKRTGTFFNGSAPHNGANGWSSGVLPSLTFFRWDCFSKS